jgi:hypothetical protein
MERKTVAFTENYMSGVKEKLEKFLLNIEEDT